MSRSRWPLMITLTLSLLAGPAMAVTAQPADGVSSSAGVNADKVDGKDAVSATSKKKARANKLVATDTKGFLPGNIVKPLWGLIQGLPAILVDGQVSWGELLGIPAGFADGSDDQGVTGVKLTTVTQQRNLGPEEWEALTVLCPAGAKVSGGGHLIADLRTEITDSFPQGDRWIVWGRNTDPVNSTGASPRTPCV